MPPIELKKNKDEQLVIIREGFTIRRRYRFNYWKDHRLTKTLVLNLTKNKLYSTSEGIIVSSGLHSYLLRWRAIPL